jgi:hypothetical protein
LTRVNCYATSCSLPIFGVMALVGLPNDLESANLNISYIELELDFLHLSLFLSLFLFLSLVIESLLEIVRFDKTFHLR